MPAIETKDVIATYQDTPEVRDAVFKRVLEYFKKFEAFHGESIHQMDDTIIYAPDVLSDIADDILKFEVCYKDEDTEDD